MSAVRKMAAPVGACPGQDQGVDWSGEISVNVLFTVTAALSIIRFMKTKTYPEIPLFQQYSVPELVRRLPYTEGYLYYIKVGYRPPTQKFMATVCAVLNQSELELFGSPEISGEVEE